MTRAHKLYASTSFFPFAITKPEAKQGHALHMIVSQMQAMD
jgi:hypothetical protein